MPIECVRDEESNHLDLEYKNDTEQQLHDATKKIAPQAAVPSVTATAIPSGKEDIGSVADEIHKLKYLLDHGVLSKAEFQAEKIKTLEKFGFT